MKTISFKERVRNELIQYASIYKSVFLDYDYLVYSKDFTKQFYYIIMGHETNYLHLTGVNSTLSSRVFYEKCINGTLEESDFDFNKRGQNDKAVKGSIRRKLKALSLLPNFFFKDLVAEENFMKNKVTCSLATTENDITVGFINVRTAIPKTLLKGNELNLNNAVKISLILRRKRNEDSFSEIISGEESAEDFIKLSPEVNKMVKLF